MNDSLGLANPRLPRRVFLEVLSPLLLLCCLPLCAAPARAQQTPAVAAPATQSDDALPEIPEEPRAVDPGQFMNPALAKSATVDLNEVSLREVIAWLGQASPLPVVVDQRALDGEGVLLGDPVSDSLKDAPIYFVLNRLSILGLAWYVEDEVVHITTRSMGVEHMTTRPYTIGDLLDQGYAADTLVDGITSIVDPESYIDAGGAADIQVLGDVLFVRQTDSNHRLLNCFLAGVRKHARQTMIAEPSQHAVLRGLLSQNIDVDLSEVPLDSAIRTLAEQSKADIRLDWPALRDAGVRRREPISLQLRERSLRTVLDLLVSNLDLAWIMRDGVLWITTPEQEQRLLVVALYDVRDLCRNNNESDALLQAIQSQTDPESWLDAGGEGDVRFLRPGLMAVRHTEQVQASILKLLEAYRTALRGSKPRGRATDPSTEMATKYYRMDSGVAQDLLAALPMLVAPETWKANQADAPGTIFRLTSPPETKDTHVLERAVLVIHQSLAVHGKIAEVIQKVETGDAQIGMGGMGGMGGGGFGGGLFSVPHAPLPHASARTLKRE